MYHVIIDVEDKYDERQNICALWWIECMENDVIFSVKTAEILRFS